jgi:hypothetical protein
MTWASPSAEDAPTPIAATRPKAANLLDGELWIDDRELYPGDYNAAQAPTGDARVWSETGCTCVLVTSTRDILPPASCDWQPVSARRCAHRRDRRHAVQSSVVFLPSR